MDHATGPAHALAATTITIAGIATGLNYEVLLAGFAGALASISYLEAMTLFRRIGSLVSATLLAGYTAPVGATYVAKWLPAIADSLTPLVFASFIIGLLAQAIVPAVMRFIKRKGETYEGPSI